MQTQPLAAGCRRGGSMAVAWRRMLRDFPLPLWRRPNAGRSILARQWLLRRRRRGICGGGVAVVGLLGCLAAFHSVSQLVSPSNLGSAYYYCSGAGVLWQIHRKRIWCKEVQIVYRLFLVNYYLLRGNIQGRQRQKYLVCTWEVQ